VKRGNDQPGQGVLARQQLLDPLSHLIGGLVRKCHSRDGGRWNSFFMNQMGDSVCDDPGLPASGSGKDQQRTLRKLDGFALLRIKAAKKIHG
jgi:hypothetical protein